MAHTMLNLKKSTWVSLVALLLVTTTPALAEENCFKQYEAVKSLWDEGQSRKVSGNRKHAIRSQLRQAERYCRRGEGDLAIHYLEVVRSAIGLISEHQHQENPERGPLPSSPSQ